MNKYAKLTEQAAKMKESMQEDWMKSMNGDEEIVDKDRRITSVTKGTMDIGKYLGFGGYVPCCGSSDFRRDYETPGQ